MSDIEQLREWADLARIPRESVNEKSDLVGFFQHFRPTGEGLGAVLDGHELAEEIKERLLECYRASDPSPEQTYFDPLGKCDAQTARELIDAHFRDLRSVAESMEDQELIEVLASVSMREVSEQEFEASIPDDESVDTWIFDLATDFMNTLEPIESPLLLLKDAMYSMANDKLLQSYLMWPFFRESAQLTEPFRSYFTLWASGAKYSIPSEEEGLFCI